MNPYTTPDFDLPHRLTKLILKPDRKFWAERIEDLIQKNNQILGTKHRGFRFGNCWYEDGGRTTPNLQWGPELHPSLVGDMLLLDRHRTQQAKDFNEIRELLWKLLLPCKFRREERDALPECVAQLDPELRELPRMNEEAWTIQTDLQALREYRMVLPKIHTYCAMRYVT